MPVGPRRYLDPGDQVAQEVALLDGCPCLPREAIGHGSRHDRRTQQVEEARVRRLLLLPYARQVLLVLLLRHELTDEGAVGAAGLLGKVCALVLLPDHLVLDGGVDLCNVLPHRGFRSRAARTSPKTYASNRSWSTVTLPQAPTYLAQYRGGRPNCVCQ